MIVAGLTGSIGMGKSTVLKMFEELGAAVWNADDAVHRLYAKGGAGVGPVGREFPGAVVGGAVDRDKLAGFVLGDAQKLRRLEQIVHPLVSEDRENFLALAESDRAQVVMLDIPLLFEKNYEAAFDVVVVVSAPADVQRARVLARPGMSEEKFKAILAQQMPDAEKRARADFVIDTGLTLEQTNEQVRKVMAALKARGR